MRIFVTGSSGFIGQNLILKLADLGHDVIGFDVESPRATPGRYRHITGDLRDRVAVDRAIDSSQPGFLFHLGARTDLRGRSLDDYAANTTGTSNVIEAVKRRAPETHVVYASSRLVFAIDHKPAHNFDYKPSTIYGESKIETERRVITSASEAGPWTIVRPTSIWGPWFGVPYRDFFETVRRKRFLIVRGTNPRKSFGYVGNAVHQLVSLLHDSERANGKVLWLADYQPVAVNDWATMIANEIGTRVPRHAPLGALKAIAAGGDLIERFGKSAPLTSFRLANLLTDMTYDTSESEEIFGALPYDLHSGIVETVAWMRTHPL